MTLPAKPAVRILGPEKSPGFYLLAEPPNIWPPVWPAAGLYSDAVVDPVIILRPVAEHHPGILHSRFSPNGSEPSKMKDGFLPMYYPV